MPTASMPHAPAGADQRGAPRLAAQARWIILVTDEHALSREAICLLLSRVLPDAVVCETLPNQDSSFSPACFVSLVLFALRPPYLKALAALKNLRHRFPLATVILLSDVMDSKVVAMARSRGANGLFHTAGNTEDLLAAIRHALDGKPGFPPERLNGVLNRDYHFSPRQMEVLNLMCLGKTNKEIGAMLNMSSNTVRTHVAAIFSMMGVRNRTEAVVLGRHLV